MIINVSNFINDALDEAEEEIERIFNEAGTRISLILEDGHLVLFVEILTPIDTQEAVNNLTVFWDDWLIKQPEYIQRNLTFDVHANIDLEALENGD